MIKNGKIWPIAIGLSFIFVIALIIGTIKVSLNYPVEKSNDYMRDYHDADKNANEIIGSQIAFNSSYNVEFLTDKIDASSTILKFKVTDKNGNSVDNATVEAILTRPDRHEFDIKLSNPKIENGIYTFDSVTLPKEGRWNMISKITIGENSRYLNLKADTREKEFKFY